MKDAFNVNDFLGILEQGVKINKRREDKEASVKKVSSKETAPSLEDLFEASEPIETFVNPVSSVEDSQSSDGFLLNLSYTLSCKTKVLANLLKGHLLCTNSKEIFYNIPLPLCKGR